MRRNSLGALIGAVLIAGLIGVMPGTAGAAGHMKPGAPINPTVTPADTAIVVSWSPPSYVGSSPVEGYVVAVHQGRLRPTCTSTGPTSCLAIGLANGRPVSIHVHAYNASGSGKAAYVAGIPDTVANCSYVGPYANLQGCNFAFTNLSGDDLTGANLTGANLEGTNLSDTHLGGAVLTGANLQYIGSGGIVGTPAALPLGWGVGGGYLMGPGVSLDFLNLSGITFPAADLTGANLSGSTLTGATLTAVTSFATTDLEYANFSGADIQGANLAGADMDYVGSGGVTGTPASLPPGWGIAGGYLVGPNASLSWGTDLSNAIFPVSSLAGANLEGANVSGAELAAVTSMENTNLSYANFSGADLTGEDLTGANLTGATFSLATVTGITWSNTTCPDGSNSDTNGSSPDSCIGYGM
jgi:uncharacterized protein YjbI with pentapeptide repeats